MGLAGLVDVAEDVGYPRHKEDIGLALAYHGVEPGPYFVLPLLGPSNVRDALGRGVAVFLNPTYYLGATDLSSSDASAISGGLTATDVINTRAGLLETIESAKEASLDYYLFTRAAYYQLRERDLYDGNPPAQELDFDDEFDDEDDE